MTKIFLATIVSAVFHFTVFAQAPQKTFTEKLDGIQTSGKELTKNSGTDNSSIGQSGVMTTTVPLVTISSRTLSFPLELHYASGIAVDQSSGPAGLGWALPIGSITRDYGAFEPDYTSTTNEASMLNSNPGYHTGWMETPNGVSVNPSDNNQFLGYNGISTSAMTMPMSDQYHVNVPGFLSNTFWNGSSTGASSYDWKLNEYERWKIQSAPKTYVISQEFSRINELNLENCTNCANKNYFGTGGSYAAAIGMLPYVKNGKVSYPTPQSGSGAWNTDNRTVEYEDFKQFTITDENGVRYVFGRALRGQKYVYNDDPYWTTQTAGGTFLPERGNFWKIDFIAEWLLTEIWSVDYVDLNGNGIADDADGGDWIRFEYTAPTKLESTTFAGATTTPMLQEVPAYREWSSFSQTDRSSSLMRELAYLTKVITPTQTVDFTISQRMDVEHDYYSKPANRVGNDYYYADRKYSSGGTTGAITDFDIVYPVETMKYDTLSVYSKLMDTRLYPSENTLTGAIVLNYAQKGSAQELAVSSFLIRDNTNADKLTDKPGDAFNINDYGSTTIKRGKTTLTSVDFFASNLNPSDKTSYMFEYGYNPSFDEVHKRAIVQQFFYPSLRQGYGVNNQPYLQSESLINYTEKITGTDGLSSTTAVHSILPSDFLIDFAYHERHYKLTGDVTSDIESLGTTFDLTSTEITHLLKPVSDPFGYYSVEGYPMAAQAWSLTKITYPTGGYISFTYERGSYSKSADSPNWSFGETSIPFIKEYNTIAKKRSYIQDDHNRKVAAVGYYDGWSKQKTLTATFEVDLPEAIGIRLKSKSVNDRINPVVVTTYAYGTGHLTSLPSGYLANCLNGFNSFVIREKLRHTWEQNYYPVQFNSGSLQWTYDYNEKMRFAALSNLSLDAYSSSHFYETTDVIATDGSKTRTFYGPIDDTMAGIYPDYSVFCTRLPNTSFWDGRFVIGGNSVSSTPIAAMKTALYEAGQTGGASASRRGRARGVYRYGRSA